MLTAFTALCSMIIDVKARLSTVIVCELVSVGCKDGVTHIHTWAIVKWGSLPTAIPNNK